MSWHSNECGPSYAIEICPQETLLAVGSLRTDTSNTLSLYEIETGAPRGRIRHRYPASRVQFRPGTCNELVATCSDQLRLFSGKGGALEQVSAFTTHSSAHSFPPLTSLSWSHADPTRIATSSVNTTCTVWDISMGTPVTQLIAHDSQVYDVAFAPASRDIFASVGAEGSARLFDLRSLEHSTVLYEQSSSDPPRALVRVAFDPVAPERLSVFHIDSSRVHTLDTRFPGKPVASIAADAPLAAITYSQGALVVAARESVSFWRDHECVREIACSTRHTPAGEPGAVPLQNVAASPSWISVAHDNAVRWTRI